jgi:hypothetical protein
MYMFVYIAEAVVWRVPKPSGSKIWSCPMGLGTNNHINKQINRNLLDWTVHPYIVAKHRIRNTFPRQQRIVGDIFYAVYVISKECGYSYQNFMSFVPRTIVSHSYWNALLAFGYDSWRRTFRKCVAPWSRNTRIWHFLLVSSYRIFSPVISI